MADFVLTPDQVGSIVLFVAPGFFARLAYEARFPRSERSTLNVIVWSVAASLPLVALGNELAALLDVDRTATGWKYVLVLLGPAIVMGYAVALVRSTPRARRALGRCGLKHQPDGSLYAMTMLSMTKAGLVTLELQDGRVISGTPRGGPSHAEGDVDELILTNPAWRTNDGNWSEDGAGAAVLVPLREVKFVTFSEDPVS
jgi:hypothetical protein